MLIDLTEAIECDAREQSVTDGTLLLEATGCRCCCEDGLITEDGKCITTEEGDILLTE